MLVKIGAVFLAGLLGLLSAGVVLMFQSGIGTVTVENEDISLYLPIPMAAVELAVLFVPQEEFDQFRRELAPAREVIREAARHLADCPDMTLVEVRDHGESVWVRKEGKFLIVDVQGDDQVKVKVPLDSVFRIVSAATRVPDDY